MVLYCTPIMRSYCSRTTTALLGDSYIVLDGTNSRLLDRSARSKLVLMLPMLLSAFPVTYGLMISHSLVIFLGLAIHVGCDQTG